MKIGATGYKYVLKCLSGYGLSRIYPIKNLNDVLRRRLRSVADVQGHRMFLDPGDTLELFVKGIHDPFETELVRKHVRRGDVVVDIGAHIGYYTLVFARLVGPEGKVFAFEPAPASFALLNRNIHGNGYRNVISIPKAVSDTSGHAKLFLSTDPVDHRIYDCKDGRESVDIETARLDEYFVDVEETVSFIKMDIQGAELAALRGMDRILRRGRDVKILTEFWPRGLNMFGVKPYEYLEALVSYGYTLYHANDQTGRLERLDVKEPLEAWMPTNKTYANVFCTRDGS